MNKPDPIRIETFDKGTCLFFDDLHTMMISMSLVFLAGDLFVRKRSPIIDLDDEVKLDKLIEMPFQGMTIKEDYSFKAYKPLKAMYENNALSQIEFNVYPPLGISVKDIPESRYISQPMLFNQRIIGSAFVNFFESNRDKIEVKFSAAPASWPSELNFARVIRNSYSHGGVIHFTNAGAAPVSWKTLTYSPSDNGKSIHTDIFVVEIIELMKDIQKHIV